MRQRKDQQEKNSKLLDTLWNSLLQLSQTIKKNPDVEFCSVRIGKEGKVLCDEFFKDAPRTEMTFNVALSKKKANIFQKRFLDNGESYLIISHNSQVEFVFSNFQENVKNFLELYLPYCFTSLIAKKIKRTFVISHFAQTLDGRIATESGDSRGIGDSENILHAHRMRALCDGIVIGSHTLERDKAKLNVRLVSGRDPVRIILGSKDQNYTSLIEASPSPIIVIHSNGKKETKNLNQINFIHLKKNGNSIPCEEILKALYANNINSIYLEGGAKTASIFLNENMIDIVQLHISPLILGSGISTFSLPVINSISQAITFPFFKYFDIGSSVMFLGVKVGGI